MFDLKPLFGLDFNDVQVLILFRAQVEAFSKVEINFHNAGLSEIQIRHSQVKCYIMLIYSTWLFLQNCHLSTLHHGYYIQRHGKIQKGIIFFS